MTSSALASLESSLRRWEWVEYIAAAVVILGVVGEWINDFSAWLKRWRYKRRLAKGSTLVLIGGLACELLGLVKTTTLSGRIVEYERGARMRLEERVAPRTLVPDLWEG